MNVAALTQYVALFCLLAFTAFSNALYAQSTEVQTEGDGKKAAPVVRKTVIRTNVNTAGQGSQDNVTQTLAPMLFTSSSSRSCCKTNASKATGTTSEEVKVVAIRADGQNGDKPKRIVVKRMVENGKETVTVNGTKVEANTSITDLPEDVQVLIEDMPAMFETSVENLGDDKIQIYKYGHGQGKANGGAQFFTFENNGEDGDVIEKHVWVNAPNCAVFGGGDSNQVYKFNFKFDAEGMKQRCEEMSKRFSEMGLDTNIAGRCQVRIMKKLDNFGVVADSVVVAMPHIPVPPMFMMDMDMEKHMDIMVEVPDAPSVRSFETDDLSDVPELYRAPEADVNSEAPTTQPAPDVHKRYKVIIIERSDDDKEEVTKELEVSSPALEEAQENTRQNTLPAGAAEDNAIRAEYFNVYPNPTPGTLNISFALTQPGAVTVTVTDLLGNKVFGETVEYLNGQYYKQLDMEQHARGTYLVRVEQNGQAISRTVSVQ